MTALIADDKMLIAGEQVGELALPLVTPLGSDDDGCWHGELLNGTAWEPGNTTRHAQGVTSEFRLDEPVQRCLLRSSVAQSSIDAHSRWPCLLNERVE
ncbi:unannotated protein [freshwater metagenome]|uniref:Unannotated protein n=1 Tax=freshwater metagenome TaxID=449393 RepID=A0A6J6J8F8_9ZZZZ